MDHANPEDEKEHFSSSECTLATLIVQCILVFLILGVVVWWWFFGRHRTEPQPKSAEGFLSTLTQIASGERRPKGVLMSIMQTFSAGYEKPTKFRLFSGV
jgi:cytoskeletal protein RodZ